MAPVLSLCSTPGQTRGHNSPCLSMDPKGYHIAGPDDPAFFGKKIKFPEKCKNSDKYINLTNICKDMQEEENERGEYHTLDSKVWELLEINKKTDSRGRINTGSESNYNVDVRVFVADVDQEPEKCKSFLLLPKSIFTEVRKTRGKDNIGEPLKIQKNGDVWTTQKEKYVKIFVRK